MACRAPASRPSLRLDPELRATPAAFAVRARAYEADEKTVNLVNAAIRLRRPVLVTGKPGMGKSTLAAALGERGYPLIADDQCAIEIGADAIPRIHADGRQLRLWERSIIELGLGERRGESMRNRLRKFYVDPAAASDAAVAVGAIYALVSIRGPEQPEIERPNVVDATKLLLTNAYRPKLVRRLDQQGMYFQGGTTIAAAAGIFRLKRPFGFDQVAGTIAMLEEHWASIGLTDGAS